MSGRASLLTSAVIIASAMVLAAAQQPPSLVQAQPGMWEIDGVPGMKTPVRQCVAAVPTLAQFEHRGKNCTAKVVKEGASSTIFEYHCGSDGFGRSKVDVLTPRSLRIETQGISQQLPFSYVLQARRVGDCPIATSASRH